MDCNWFALGSKVDHSVLDTQFNVNLVVTAVFLECIWLSFVHNQNMFFYRMGTMGKIAAAVSVGQKEYLHPPWIIRSK